MKKFYCILILLLSWQITFCSELSIKEKRIEYDKDQMARLFFTLPIKPPLYIYRDKISMNVDHPDVTVVSWRSLEPAREKYDLVLKESTYVYEKSVTFEVILKKQVDASFENSAVHMIYYTNDAHHPVTELIISLEKKAIKSPEKQNNVLSPTPFSPSFIDQQESVQKCDEGTKKSISWTTFIANLLTQQKSLPLRFLFVFFLGLIVSLTPCIYPMIPITIGVLQSQAATTSVWRNFLLAASYTGGLSTTFAIFGLLASCVGPLCGSLLSKPWFIIGLVFILAYFALSMLGFYDIKIPRVINTSRVPGGSFFAAYIFGVASGTFASPCVSPGLALVLSMVAGIGSTLLGFLFLFVFGIGLSVPLLIIGTLSNSVNLLPRAGHWMVEIKKLFGLLMIAVCFYYLSFAMPMWALEWVASGVFLLLGGFYLYNASTASQGFWRASSYIIGAGLICAASVASFYAIKDSFLPFNGVCAEQDTWLDEYEDARQHALAENRLLFVDVWATYCSICGAINNKILKNPSLQETFKEFVTAKIDITNSCGPQTTIMRERFKVQGVPALLVIDPQSEHIIKQWGSEIYTMPIEEIKRELEKALSR